MRYAWQQLTDVDVGGGVKYAGRGGGGLYGAVEGHGFGASGDRLRVQTGSPTPPPGPFFH